MCERILIAVLLAISLVSPSNAETKEDYHENEYDPESPMSLLREDEEEEVKERARLSALEAELEEQLKLSGANEGEEGPGAIPGQPGQDYPVYTSVPRTSFSCADKHYPGYYADVEARCQVFHICDAGGAKHSFLCPRGSLFHQKYLVCDWWYTSECDTVAHLLAYQHDLHKLYNKQNHQQSELPQEGDFISDEAFVSGGEENNYISSQSDIFYSAETGIPNRERFENANDTGANNRDKNSRPTGNEEKSRRDSNHGSNTHKPEVLTKPLESKPFKEKDIRNVNH